MNRQTSSVVHSVTPNEKRDNRSQASNPTNKKKPWSNAWHSSSSNEPSTAASQAQMALVIEDGFTLVSRPKVLRNKARTTYNRSLNSYAPTAPRSAAAVRRANVYEGPTPNKPPSHYKQSYLPVEERDSVLLEAEHNKGKQLPKESFKPGTIIRAILHEPDFQGVARASDVTRADRFRTDSVPGPIYTKTRKMIVLATFHDNYIAVPLYTHNG